MIKKCMLLLSIFVLGSCSGADIYAKKESPTNAYHDYKGHDKSVVGIGKTISERKEKANATISFKGSYSLEEVITKFAKRYDLSVKWGGDLDRFSTRRLIANKQTFNEARSYIEDVFNVSIVRIRDRSIKIMLPTTVKKLEMFNPGPNVRLAEAVNGLSKLCDMNLVIADYKDVLAQEKITTNLQNISCSRAFEAILSPFGLSIKSRGSHYTISGLPYKEWSLNLHEQKRSEAQEVNYSSQFSGASGSNENSSGGNYVSGGSSVTKQSYTRNLWTSLEKDLKELVEQSCKNSKSMGYEPAAQKVITKVAGLDGLDVDPLDGVIAQDSVEKVSTGKKRERPCGYVRINPDIGLVQMQAPRRVIEKADDILMKTEEIASRRLLVEARILAVTKERGYDRGADFSFSTDIAGTQVGTGFNPSQSLRKTTSGSVAAALNSFLEGPKGRLTGGGLALSSNDLDGVVRFVQSFGTTYQLMKPTLEVMDRQKAVLIDGRNEKYFIRSASVDNSGDTPLVTTETEERVQFVGIQFAVSAQVAEDEGGLHTLSLQIPITEIIRNKELTNLAGGEEITDEIPIATTRVIDQKVRIKDNEIKVIGGLTRTIAVDKETGVPLLQEVPVAGDAFSEEQVAYEEAEFIVLLQVKKLED